MDPEEIKKDLKKILDLTEKRDSQDTVENFRESSERHQNEMDDLDHKKVPSAHAILAEQEILKQYRETMEANAFKFNKNRSDEQIGKKESSLEKFTNIVMAVTQHDNYDKVDDDENLIEKVNENSSRSKWGEKSFQGGNDEMNHESLEELTDLVMAVTQHDAYNEEDNDDYLKVHLLPRGDSETTLKAVSNEDNEFDHHETLSRAERENLEVQWDLTNIEEFNSEISTNIAERNDSGVEMELELQVKVRSDTDLDAVTQAVRLIYFKKN